MFSKHLQEVLSLFRDNYRTLQCEDFDIIWSNFYPESYEDDVLRLSNGKHLKAQDFEFAELNGTNISLGNYRFILV